MCFGVCITRRGMVYFGASVHIFVSLILFIGSSVRVYRLSNYEKEDSRKEILGGVIIASYFFIILMLGCLIFRATEQKNPKLLGWTSGTFITLETFAFVFNLMILSPMGGVYDEYGFRNFGFSVNIVYIVISAVVLVCMMGYCATIIMYISKLKEDGDESQEFENAYDDEEGEAASNALSRTSSRTPSTFFQQPMLDKDGNKLSFLEVVREAKKAQQMREQSRNKHPQPHQNSTKANNSSSQNRPHNPNITSPTKLKKGPGPPTRQLTNQSQVSSVGPSESHSQHSQTSTARASTPAPNSARAPTPSATTRPTTPGGTRPTTPGGTRPTTPGGTRPTTPGVSRPTTPGPAVSSDLAKTKEQTTQTVPHVPYPPHPPNLSSYSSSCPFSHHSQTLPHQRKFHFSAAAPPVPNVPQQEQHFGDYSQRGILSAPSFASAINTASILPNRFRNPSSGLRTTKSGTLVGRAYETQPRSPTPPPPMGTRMQSMQRQTSSSCSSMDPTVLNYDAMGSGADGWELPRVQALKYNYHYNALRRGTHRSDYGVEV